MIKEKILLVDDEPNVLDGLRRHLEREYDVDAISDPVAALEKLKQKNVYSVVVSDLRMPKLSGIQLLSHVKEANSDVVRIMLTGQAELSDAIEAINNGNIFRFLTKPCESTDLKKSIDAGIRQYHLIKAEKVLLGKTLRGSIKVLVEILSMLHPAAFGKGSRIQKLTSQIAEISGLKNKWDLEIASLLSQIGCIVVPEEILNKAYNGELLTQDEEKVFNRYPVVGHKLLSHIPRLEKTAEIVLHHNKHKFELEFLDNDYICKAASILKTVLDYDTLLSRKNNNAAAAIGILSRNEVNYDLEIVEFLKQVLATQKEYKLTSVKITGLKMGMILACDITTVDGKLMIAKGQEISESLIERLHNISRSVSIKEPVEVFL